MKILIGVYSHPEFYPPTLNAIEVLARTAEKITVVSRNVFKSGWKYPGNVTLVSTGSYVEIRESEKKSLVWKVLSFLKFQFRIIREFRKNYDWVIAYDEVPLMSMFLAGKLSFLKPVFWYHNHDPKVLSREKPGSVFWLAKLIEPFALKTVGLFSLPTLERVKFFDLSRFSGKIVFLPNWPLKQVYSDSAWAISEPGTEVHLLYQGFINENKGFESLIPVLGAFNDSQTLHLNLKGSIREDFKEKLRDIAIRAGVLPFLHFHPFGTISEVQKLAKTCHIGLGLHINRTDPVGSTIGLATNKIYEYAATGLPVIVFDSPYFREHLQEFSWISFSDGSAGSLLASIRNLLQEYSRKAQQARSDFEEKLHFEVQFNLENIRLNLPGSAHSGERKELND